MSNLDIIRHVDIASLRVIQYPDPRLLTPSVELEEIDEPTLRPLIQRMFELMFLAKGVGLAAPQVGINLRLFVGSPSYEPTALRVYINPRILSAEDHVDDEEGCLSVPGIHVQIRRYAQATIEATDLTGGRFQEAGKGLLARLYQHETDHLDGRLVVDRMSPIARLSHRRTLRELEEKFAEKSTR